MAMVGVDRLGPHRSRLRRGNYTVPHSATDTLRYIYRYVGRKTILTSLPAKPWSCRSSVRYCYSLRRLLPCRWYGTQVPFAPFSRLSIHGARSRATFHERQQSRDISNGIAMSLSLLCNAYSRVFELALLSWKSRVIRCLWAIITGVKFVAPANAKANWRRTWDPGTKNVLLYYGWQLHGHTRQKRHDSYGAFTGESSGKYLGDERQILQHLECASLKLQRLETCGVLQPPLHTLQDRVTLPDVVRLHLS